MKKTASINKKRPSELTEKRIEAIIDRLRDDKQVRRPLPVWGRVHIDRPLPFLCIYRRPVNRSVPGTDRLISSQASYINAPGDRSFHPQLARLLERLVSHMTERFGAFMILEVWTGPKEEILDGEPLPRAGFRVVYPPGSELPSTIKVFQEGLMAVKTKKQKPEVSASVNRKIAPPGMLPLLPAAKLQDRRCYILGLEIKPTYINKETNEIYPLLLRAIRRQLSSVLQRTFYHFTRKHTIHRPSHYHALGRRAVVKAVWEVDEGLAAVSNSFDLLYQVTPVNAEQAWKIFHRNKFEKQPFFLYRPSPVDPAIMKRKLFDIRIERVEDPTLMQLFMNKQLELDRQLTMLHDLDSKSFFYESLQLHGNVSNSLKRAAEDILEHTPSRGRRDGKGKVLNAGEFADLAREEVAHYARLYPDFKASVQVSGEMYSGLLVSRGRLLIGKETRIPSHRAHALLQHEVGTHLLTYFNGRAQPFRMLYTGLPGYDEMQEGLAVLSEYLVGGLTAERMRVLAARVVAARARIDGAGFIDVFRLLERTYRFSQQSSYTITMRIFRGGGLVKDAVYLRGLQEVLKNLAEGNGFDTLFIGKIAQEHVAVVEELLLRNILRPPPVRPRYLDSQEARARVDIIRRGIAVKDLLRKEAK
jgi:uncharacterized protein (TIGR02421 family)